MRRILFILAFFAMLASSEAQISSEKEKVKLYLGWTHQFQFAGYYAAKEFGYYDSLGYDVELIQGRGNDQVDGLLSGDFDYAVLTAAGVIADDRNSKLAVLAAFFQQSPVTLIALKSNGVNSLKDLEGGRVMGRTEIASMLMAAGVDLNKVDLDPNSAGMDDLLNGNYDAITYYVADQIRMIGADSVLFKTFRPIEYGINYYGECLVTTQKEINENESRAIDIRQATIDGWNYAVENPEVVVEMIFEKYNTGFTRQELRDEAEITINSLVQPYFHDIGDMQKSKWAKMIQTINTVGFETGEINLDLLIYDPDTNLNKRSRNLLMILGIVVVTASLILVGMALYNFQLKKAVNDRTASLQKTNNELDRFVYSVSHDIKSPLSSIQGIINLMKMDPSRQEKYMEMIETSVIQLENFTSEILDYSRNSRSEIISKPVDVDRLVDNTISELKYLNSNDNVKFIKEMKIDGTFDTDEWRLKTILSNLISNAVKYSDKTKNDRYVKIQANRENGSLIIDVEDNGIGIEHQHMDKIYDMFYRATEESKGSGLGLYIVNETVRALNGAIDIKSEPNVGTTISLKIPSTS